MAASLEPRAMSTVLNFPAEVIQSYDEELDCSKAVWSKQQHTHVAAASTTCFAELTYIMPSEDCTVLPGKLSAG